MTSDAIAKVREELGLTQAELAQLVGVHTLTISKWEREVLSPTSHQIALLDAFSRAAKKDPHAGPTAVQLLKMKGVAAALHHLLNSAIEPLS
jgi:DNA-binding XRE family transcriptional regulator